MTQDQLAGCSWAQPALVMWRPVPAALIPWASGREPVLLWTQNPRSQALNRLENSAPIPSSVYPDISRQAKDVAVVSVPAAPSFAGPSGSKSHLRGTGLKADCWLRVYHMDESLVWQPGETTESGQSQE